MISKLSKSTSNIIFVLGGPGTGKGTVCQFLAKKFNFYHMSVGQLLRRVKRSDADFEIINQHMINGSIVPSKISCRLIQEALMQLCNYNIILIDGFPRNFDNFNGWKKSLSTQTNLLKIFHLICTDQIMIERCLSRSKFKSNQRIDDELDIINLRITQYKQEILPLIDYFQGKYPVVSIDASRNVDEVTADISNIQSLLQSKLSSE